MDDNPIVGRVLEYRELSKLKSTYIDTLPDLAHPSTGRLHTTFNQAGTATGRLSSANPNLQNIPIRTARGREIRRAFVAGREGWTLLAIDYSQIDLRVLAHISEDAAMCQAFANGHDIHSSTAASLHEVPLDEVTEDMRRLAKTTNFGIVYGISAQGLASRTEFSRGEAARFIETYFATYPGVKGYMDSTIAQAHERGYVETLFQRRRYLPELNSRAFHERAAAERMAINMPIQGTTADIMKVAMVKLARAIREQGFAAQMLLQVHDDLLFELPTEELDDFAGSGAGVDDRRGAAARAAGGGREGGGELAGYAGAVGTRHERSGVRSVESKGTKRGKASGGRRRVPGDVAGIGEWACDTWGGICCSPRLGTRIRRVCCALVGAMS